jgi:hypothetical protein
VPPLLRTKLATAATFGRSHGIEEVTGSTPVRSTTLYTLIVVHRLIKSPSDIPKICNT